MSYSLISTTSLVVESFVLTTLYYPKRVFLISNIFRLKRKELTKTINFRFVMMNRSFYLRSLTYEIDQYRKGQSTKHVLSQLETCAVYFACDFFIFLSDPEAFPPSIQEHASKFDLKPSPTLVVKLVGINYLCYCFSRLHSFFCGRYQFLFRDYQILLQDFALISNYKFSVLLISYPFTAHLKT